MTLGDGDEYSPVRDSAADALLIIGEPAVEYLIKHLGKVETFKVRSAVTHTLIEIGEPAVVPLIKTLRDEDDYVRSSAARILITTGDERAIVPLIEVLSNYFDKELAEVYLSCGNTQLEEAAQIWAGKHGYTIQYLPTGVGSPSWGGSSE